MSIRGRHSIHIFIFMGILIELGVISCKKKTPVDPSIQDQNGNPAADDYSMLADRSFSSSWGPYNLHDPTIVKHGDDFYIFSTDVAYGPNGRCGIMYRRSNDLVHWTFLGWVFDGVPPKPLAFMEANQPGYRQESIWAPYILKVEDKYRLYYSVPGNDGLKLACIALATATTPDGPWTDEGIVISCLPSDDFNAIDPSVVIDQMNGRHWMTYGSYFAGVFIVELDPATGKVLNPGDKGKRLAYRNRYMDAIEGSEILYNPELGKYYLFVSYDWLEDNYNVRVGRANRANGPYYDITGADMSAAGDNFPMITARYKFNGHAGWQGFGHCGLLREGNDYFYVSQARLGSNKYLMDLHIHRIIWTPSGWPAILPERYAALPQTAVDAADLVGKWEHIDLTVTDSFNESIDIEFASNGVIGGIQSSTWSFKEGLLTLRFHGGDDV
ncbi:MAG TPA: arabinan endo-1,5-alpha-L-arabinosidase [bacterium]